MKHSIPTTLLTSSFLLAALATLPTDASAQVQDGPTEWLYWDGLRRDGSFYGGRVAIPLVPRSTHRIPAPVTTLFETYGAGSADNRVDIVIVGDGYTNSEQDQFQDDAARMAVSILSYEPFSTYQGCFAIHTVEVVSNDSGVDGDPFSWTVKDTAMDMGFWCGGMERLLCVDTSKAQAFANSVPGVDQVIVLANSSKYGGAGYADSDMCTASGQHFASDEVVVHELGHSFGNLADEYDYGDGLTWTGGEPSQPNVSILTSSEMASAGTKWSDWLGVDDSNFNGLVGTYEGAKYHEFGIYRPTSTSMMRSSGRPFNLPSVESLLIEMYKKVSPIDGSSDESLMYTGGEILVVQPVILVGTGSLEVQWFLDGAAIPGATGNLLDMSLLGLSTCGHVVQVRVTDATNWVRDENARSKWMTDSRTFIVAAVPGVPPGGSDCDGNGESDDCQIMFDPSLDWNGDGVLDSCSAPNYCKKSLNSTGKPGVMYVFGSPVIAENDFMLIASQLPIDEWGYFLMSRTKGWIPFVGGSSGHLCLGSPFYRFNSPPTGQTVFSGLGGTFSFSPDLTNLPQGAVFAAGEIWRFQAWYRDGKDGTSNFTDGIEVMFR